MQKHKIANHLRAYRKRSVLSQHEVAFMLGWRDASQPSRYESFSRTPTLRTALALAMIFQVSISKLFPGEYQKAQTDVRRRAQLLEKRLRTVAHAPKTMHKLAALKIIMSGNDNRETVK
jgi:transcriptional regulator with XRE-family HTH domain